ncbi:MAG TPA: ABC transporter substrate-binding protein [Polyangiaceae bacterium]|nr:ABC transporter substrate-binding protein [Polyangiaceae bacterium]
MWLDRDARKRFLRDGSALLGLGLVAALVLFALLGPLLIPADPNVSDFTLARGPSGAPPGPSAAHPLGADPLHRDLLARLAEGARISLSLALAATLLSLAVGSLVGVAAGYLEGTPIDRALMRFVDVMLAFPYLLLVTAIGVAIDRTDALSVVLVLGLTSWTGVARVTRAKTLEIRGRDYVTAARALGAGAMRIVGRHIVPGLRATLLIIGSHAVAQMILAEAVLGYLTVGIEPPQASWGRMLHEAEHYLGVQPLVVAAPGIAILLSVVGFTRLGDGLRDALDPLLRVPGRGLLRLSVDALVLAGALLLVGFSDAEPLAGPLAAPLASAAIDAPRRGGVLRLATKAEVHNLDPALAYDEASRVLGDHLFARLVTWSDDGSISGELAERFDTLDGGRRYRFVLRPALRFHDGTRLAASDVKRSLERLLDVRTPSPGAHLYQGIKGFEAFRKGKAQTLSGVRAVDARTVEIALSRADATFLSLMTMGFAAPVCASMGAVVDPKAPARPCGAGPFQLEAFEPGERISLRRFPHWLEPGKPFLDGIDWLLGVHPRTQRYRFEARALDMVTELTGVDTARFAADPRWTGYQAWIARPATQGIFLNTEVPPLDNRHMRRAIAFAIDPEVLSMVHPGVAATARVVPPGVPGPREPPMRVHDRERALEEMKLAGYPFDPESGRGGYPNVIDYVTVPDSFEQSSAEIFQQQLARVGIRIRLKLVSWAAWLSLVSTRGAAPMGWRGWQADYPDPSTFFEPILTTSAIADSGSQNVSFFSNRELDDVVTRARSETDGARRMALYQRAEEIVRDEAPWVPAWVNRTMHVWQPGVRGYRAHPVEPLRLRDVWLAAEGTP